MDLSDKALDELETSSKPVLDSAVCGYVRAVAKGLFQGNCTFLIDDIDLMAATANWALLNGIPDDG